MLHPHTGRLPVAAYQQWTGEHLYHLSQRCYEKLAKLNFSRSVSDWKSLSLMVILIAIALGMTFYAGWNLGAGWEPFVISGMTIFVVLVVCGRHKLYESHIKKPVAVFAIFLKSCPLFLQQPLVVLPLEVPPPR